MRNRMRSIVVNGRRFLWRFHDARLSEKFWRNSLRIVPQDGETRVTVVFIAREDWMGGNPFKLGVPALKGGEKKTVNLNTPEMVAAVILALWEDGVFYPGGGEVCKEGVAILGALGWRIDPHILPENTEGVRN